jgi:protein pelota
MRILKKNFHKGNGFIVLVAMTDEDLWHAYNLIVPGDYFKMTTFRKVVHSSSTGVKNV